VISHRGLSARIWELLEAFSDFAIECDGPGVYEHPTRRACRRWRRWLRLLRKAGQGGAAVNSCGQSGLRPDKPGVWTENPRSIGSAMAEALSQYAPRPPRPVAFWFSGGRRPLE